MKWHYFIHLVAWTVPVIVVQWAIGAKILRRNLRAVLAPACVGAVFFSLIDQVAVRGGIWSFDDAQILGWKIGVLPVEETMFFFLTSLLVTQSLVLLLPRGYRHE